MLCVEGKTAVFSFCLFSLLTSGILYFLMDDAPSSFLSVAAIMVLPFSSLHLLSFFPHSDVSQRAGFIGAVFGTALAATFLAVDFFSLSLYFVCLAIFHISEYLLVAWYNPDKLNVDSFLLNHSTEYSLAVVMSWIEFLVQMHFFPGYKQFGLIAKFGLIIAIFGQVLRKVAMVTAERSFTHLVQYEKRPKHILVTHGVYAYSRHPSYVGWFYWSIGSQLLLCNPICLVLYAVASWRFFNDRIPEEEYFLIQFFEDSYIEYMKKTPTGLPFIHGLDNDIAKLKKTT